MRRESLKLLEDARAACAEIESFISGRTEADFLEIPLLQRGVERSVEIVVEALRRLRDLDPEAIELIPDFRRIIGMRNILAHGYDALDYGVV